MSKKIVVFSQRICAHLNETTSTTDAVKHTGAVREDIVQDDLTRNIKNFTTIIRDINIIAGHIGYVVLMSAFQLD
jgi:hypothetical protein